MPRQVPSSNKQKRSRLQQKRAVKRGDISPPPPFKPDRPRKANRQAEAYVPAVPSDPDVLKNIALVESARRLQSNFTKLPKEFLQETKRLAADLPLTRPVPSEAALWKDGIQADPQTTSGGEAGDRATTVQLTCPTRPEWRYDMSKVEVEMNEEVAFNKWLEQTDTAVHAWSTAETPPPHADPDTERMPSAPTTFERNLEVWRQL